MTTKVRHVRGSAHAKCWATWLAKRRRAGFIAHVSARTHSSPNVAIDPPPALRGVPRFRGFAAPRAHWFSFDGTVRLVDTLNSDEAPAANRPRGGSGAVMLFYVRRGPPRANSVPTRDSMLEIERHSRAGAEKPTLIEMATAASSASARRWKAALHALRQQCCCGLKARLPVRVVAAYFHRVCLEGLPNGHFDRLHSVIKTIGRDLQLMGNGGGIDRPSTNYQHYAFV